MGEEGDAPYLVVSANDAIYVRAAIDEFSYQTLAVGDTVLLSDWQTGGQCEAKVVELSQYPSDQTGWSDKNPNVSFYWFVAEAPLSDELSFQYGADVSIPRNTNTFYLSKTFLTTENGRYYAYVSGEDQILHKVEVTTGATQYSMIEIVDGFTMEDNIALPFGKEVREGASTVLSEEYGGW